MDQFIELLKEINIVQIFIILSGGWVFYNRLKKDLKQDISKLDNRLDKIDIRLSNLEMRITIVETKIFDMNQNLSRLMWQNQITHIEPKEK